MNDFGFALVWLAIQVACLLIPALILQAAAARRSSASGAWVATWSLALVLGLGGLMVFSAVGPRRETGEIPPARSSSTLSASITASGPGGLIDSPASIEPARFRGFSLDRLRSTWERIERRATEPAARIRSWGRVLALLGLAGSALGLIRLVLGLWAIHHCRSRGRVVNDPALLGLIDELRTSMGCRQTIEVREVPDRG